MPWLVVGLGNPGPKYAGHRHNVGFLVVDELARRGAASFRQKFHGQFARARLAGGLEDSLLLEPMTYMNRSGISVGAAASFFKVAPAETLVIHDDLDLPFGDVRLKSGGGHGGHNGLRSLFEHFGSDFHRIRCGIGRPIRGGDVSGYVLSDFDSAQRAELPDIVDAAADAIERVLREGTRKAMNTINAKTAESGRTPAQVRPSATSEPRQP